MKWTIVFLRKKMKWTIFTALKNYLTQKTILPTSAYETVKM